MQFLSPKRNLDYCNRKVTVGWLLGVGPVCCKHLSQYLTTDSIWLLTGRWGVLLGGPCGEGGATLHPHTHQPGNDQVLLHGAHWDLDVGSTWVVEMPRRFMPRSPNSPLHDKPAFRMRPRPGIVLPTHSPFQSLTINLRQVWDIPLVAHAEGTLKACGLPPWGHPSSWVTGNDFAFYSLFWLNC